MWKSIERRLSGTKAMPARQASRGAARPQDRLAADRRIGAGVGPELAEQRARQLDQAAAHEAVDAQNLAGPDVERHVGEGAAGAEPAHAQDDRRARACC